MVSSTIIGAGILGVGALLFLSGSPSLKSTLRGGGASGVLKVAELKGAVVSSPTKKSETSSQPDTTIIIEAEKIISPFGDGQPKKEIIITDSGGTFSGFNRIDFIEGFRGGKERHITPEGITPPPTGIKKQIRTRDLIATAPLIVQKQVLTKLPKFNFRQAFGTIFGRFF